MAFDLYLLQARPFSPVDADAPPGEVYLDVGFYLVVGEAGVNLPLVVDGQMTDVTSVAIGPIVVLNP